MNDEIQCWRCGESTAEWPQPFSRYAACRKCRADLHVCRLCRFYDRNKAKQCNEPVADEVSDKERANFCGYFIAKPQAFAAAGDASAQARAKLDALFGHPTDSTAPAAGDERAPLSAAERARRELEALFKKDD